MERGVAVGLTPRAGPPLAAPRFTSFVGSPKNKNGDSVFDLAPEPDLRFFRAEQHVLYNMAASL